MRLDADRSTTRSRYAELIGARAHITPSSPALVDGQLELDYAELVRASCAIAGALRDSGVRPGDRVVLMGPHGAVQVAAILATSLLGAVFVPIDAALPLARIHMLLFDARPKLLLAPDAFRVQLEAKACEVFLPWHMAERHLRDSLGAGPAPELVQPERAIAADDIAYIIYTSGSTGRPKGVQITHAALSTFIETYNVAIGIGVGDRCLNTGPFHFDVCLLDVFLPLCFGATVYLRPPLPVGSLILHELASRRITHVYAVGTLLAQLTADGSPLDCHDLSALKVLQTGAEPCKPLVVNHWLRRYPQLRFVNSFGPTEATVGCIQYAKPEPGPVLGERCPIGTPHHGTRVQLLDLHGLTIRTPWLVGELLLGGPQIMAGYWAAPEATRRAFVELDGEIYYRSGDLAYRDPDGLYWFVGRRDDQIKFLGHRMHLRELRDALVSHPEVSGAAAGVVKDTHGQDQLAVIGLVLRQPSIVLGHSMIDWTRQRLPSYMVPGVLGLCARWPRMPSGKADLTRCLEELKRAAARFGRGIYVRTDERFIPLRGGDAGAPVVEAVPP